MQRGGPDALPPTLDSELKEMMRIPSPNKPC